MMARRIFASSSLLPMADQGLNSLSNFSLVAAGLWLSVHNYGELGVTVAAYVVAIGLLRAFLLEPLTAQRRLSSMGRRLVLPLTVEAVVGSATLCGAGFLAEGTLRTLMLVLAAGLPFLLLQDTGRYVALHRQRAGLAVIADAGWLLGFAAVAVILVALGKLGTVTLFSSWLVSGVASCAVLVPSVLVRSEDRGNALGRFSIGFGLDYLLGALFIQFAQLAIAAAVPIAAYGRLRAATTVMAPTTVLFTATSSTLLATATLQALDSAERLSHWVRRLRWQLVALAGGYSIVALLLIAFLGSAAPPSVRVSTALLGPVTVGNLILAFDTPNVLRLKALQEQGALARARSIQAAVAILAPFAALELGIVAAAWTLTISQVVGYALRLRIVARLRTAQSSRERHELIATLE